MLVRHYDLPLAEDESSRFLPWIVALMVYLATLSLATALTVSGLIARWSDDVSAAMTVQVTPQPGAADAVSVARVLNRAVDILRAERGVIAAEPLDQQELHALLAPWLGEDFLRSGDLPLPQLIDVVVDPSTGITAARLQQLLSAEIKGVLVDDHRMWMNQLVNFALSIEAVAVLVFILVALAGVGTVIFATRAGFTIHMRVVEVLHLIGAQDSYIAGQFQSHALALGMRGGLIGLAFAAVTLFLIVYLAYRIDSPLLPIMPFHPLWLLALLVVPAAAAAITMLTARITVMRNLARMM